MSAGWLDGLSYGIVDKVRGRVPGRFKGSRYDIKCVICKIY